MHKNKYVSNLDLKYLDAKFTVIKDCNPTLTKDMNEIRKTKVSQFPSIIKSRLYQDDTTINTSTNLQSRVQIDCTKFDRQLVRYASMNSCNNQCIEQRDIVKYKYFIKKMRRDNQSLHREIKNFYEEKLIRCNQLQTKQIHGIYQAKREISKKQIKVRRNSQAKKYESIYQDLNSDDNPYRIENLQIQKKLSNSHLPKNFEQFLLKRNKRVPQFVKHNRE